MDLEIVKKTLKGWENGRLEHLRNYYLGNHSIVNRTQADGTKPNNKLMHNFPSYIVDVFKGYFIGEPVTYRGEDELLGIVQGIFNYNDEQDINSEIANDMGVYGKAYEVVYLDEQTKLRFNNIDPRDIRVIYNGDITPEIIGAVRRYTVGKIEYVEVYDSEMVRVYQHKDGVLTLESEQIHVFGIVPVIEYRNNTEEKGDFEDVISLIDAYNLSRSDKTNDLEYFTDAILMLRGMMSTTAEQVSQLKEDRVLLLDSEGGADWLIKPSNTAEHDSQIETLRKDIHKFSKTVDLSDEKFAGNASGVSLQYKLFIMMQVVANKTRKFKKGLQRRLEIITNYLNFRAGTDRYDWRSIEIAFDRNEPIDDTAKINGALQLRGLGVSMETALSYLPSSIIGDVNREMEKIDNSTFGLVEEDES